MELKNNAMNVITISDNAKTLLAALRASGGLHESNCIKALFPEPKYGESKEEKAAYWQWDVNINGIEWEKPVNGELVLFTPTANYSSVISQAYQELRKAGLACERNNGYNSYTFFPL